jgi:hypothetical protein
LTAVDYYNVMLDRLDEAPDERIKDLWETKRDKLRVARAYNKIVRKDHFMLGILFGRQFFLSGPKAINSETSRQIGKDHIELRK